MDERDVRIIKSAAKLGSGSPDRIAEDTEIPKSTVHYRINQLKKEEVIVNDLLDLDLDALNLEIKFISEVIAEYDEHYHKRVGEKLADIEGVNQVYFTMGDTDFFVIANLSDRKMVREVVAEYEKIDEIVRTSSHFVIETIKDEPRPLNDFSVETLLEIIDSE